MTSAVPELNLPLDDARTAALTVAIRSGDTDRLRRLLENNPDLATARVIDHTGVRRTLVHLVADWPGHYPNGAQTVAVLVEAGADVNAPVIHSRPTGAPETPLHWAASSNDVAVLDALLDGGADIEAPGAVLTGGTPMSDAVVFAQWNAARRLLERGATTTLWQAAALGLQGRVQELCATDPPPTEDQITNALWHACHGGQLSVVQDLLERGADLHWVGYDAKTPLVVARESGNERLIEWLEEWLEARGADGDV